MLNFKNFCYFCSKSKKKFSNLKDPIKKFNDFLSVFFTFQYFFVATNFTKKDINKINKIVNYIFYYQIIKKKFVSQLKISNQILRE